jgi:hypothetical protein
MIQGFLRELRDLCGEKSLFAIKSIPPSKVHERIVIPHSFVAVIALSLSLHSGAKYVNFRIYPVSGQWPSSVLPRFYPCAIPSIFSIP